MDAETAYLFRHAVLRDAAYQLQPPASRGRLHLLAVELIEALLAGSTTLLDGAAEELAMHLSLARQAEDRPGLRERQLHWTRRAAETAERRFDNAKASALWQQASAVAGPEDEAEFLRRAGSALATIARGVGGVAVTARALELARQRGQSRVVARCLTMIARQTFVSGEPERALGMVNEAIAAFAADHDNDGQCTASQVLTFILAEQGQFDRAVDVIRSSLERRRATGDVAGEARALGQLGLLYRMQKRFDEAQALQLQALAGHRRKGDIAAEGRCLGNMANLLKDAGKLAEAEATSREAMVLHVRVGDRDAQAMEQSNLGVILDLAGRANDARELMHQSLATLRETGNRRAEITTLISLGYLEFRAGRFAASEAAYRLAYTIAVAAGAKQQAMRAQGSLSLALRAAGKEPEAQEHYQASRAQLQATGQQAAVQELDKDWVEALGSGRT